MFLLTSEIDRGLRVSFQKEHFDEFAWLRTIDEAEQKKIDDSFEQQELERKAKKEAERAKYVEDRLKEDPTWVVPQRWKRKEDRTGWKEWKERRDKIKAEKRKLKKIDKKYKKRGEDGLIVPIKPKNAAEAKEKKENDIKLKANEIEGRALWPKPDKPDDWRKESNPKPDTPLS